MLATRVVHIQQNRHSQVDELHRDLQSCTAHTLSIEVPATPAQPDEPGALFAGLDVGDGLFSGLQLVHGGANIHTSTRPPTCHRSSPLKKHRHQWLRRSLPLRRCSQPQPCSRRVLPSTNQPKASPSTSACLVTWQSWTMHQCPSCKQHSLVRAFQQHHSFDGLPTTALPQAVHPPMQAAPGEHLPPPQQHRLQASWTWACWTPCPPPHHHQPLFQQRPRHAGRWSQSTKVPEGKSARRAALATPVHSTQTMMVCHADERPRRVSILCAL